MTPALAPIQAATYAYATAMFDNIAALSAMMPNLKKSRYRQVTMTTTTACIVYFAIRASTSPF